MIVLEGVNFPEVFKYSDLIDVNRIESNDIGSFLKIYGVSQPNNILFYNILIYFIN